MSSMFLWGAAFGFFTRAAACKASMIPLTSSPWKYPKYMLVAAVGFTYIDWYRRMALEQLCQNEEKLQRYCKQNMILKLKLQNIFEEHKLFIFQLEFQNLNLKPTIDFVKFDRIFIQRQINLLIFQDCCNKQLQNFILILLMKIRAKLQSLKIGEELSDAYRDQFYEHTVLKNNI